MIDAFFTRNPSPPSHLVFTDLDGTLLDHHTYAWEEALPALEKCHKNAVPVILVSSKTRAEMEVLRHQLNLAAPFVSENGGGVFFPRETFNAAPPGSFPAQTRGLDEKEGLWQWSLGTPYIHLVQALKDMRKGLGWAIKGFSEMDISEISQLTGLDKTSAHLAAMREFDEPFIFEGEAPEDLGPLCDRAAERGLTIVSGGRFHHLLGNNHKGHAMAKIESFYNRQYVLNGENNRIPTVALGDSPNDFSMLLRADFPVLVLSERNFPDLKKKIPKLKTTHYSGPKGWNSAILDILQNAKESADD